jgi:hypothetical protein
MSSADNGKRVTGQSLVALGNATARRPRTFWRNDGNSPLNGLFTLRLSMVQPFMRNDAQ